MDTTTEKIAKTIESALNEGGSDYHFREMDLLRLPAQQNPNRIYAKFVFTDGKFERIVFVKTGNVYNADLDRFISSRNNPFFFAPKPLPAFKVGNQWFAPWEFIPGQHPSVLQEDRTVLCKIADAVAGINSETEATQSAGIPLKLDTPWVAETGERLSEWATTDNDRALLSRFRALDANYLTHHDIKDANLIVPEHDKRLAVIDWATVTLSPAGSGLRTVSRLSTQARLFVARRYTETMARLGHCVNLDDVLFAIQAHQIFWSIVTGLKIKSSRRVRDGLALVENLLSPRKDNRT
jgi:hypothetical protein